MYEEGFAVSSATTLWCQMEQTGVVHIYCVSFHRPSCTITKNRIYPWVSLPFRCQLFLNEWGQIPIKNYTCGSSCSWNEIMQRWLNFQVPPNCLGPLTASQGCQQVTSVLIVLPWCLISQSHRVKPLCARQQWEVFRFCFILFFFGGEGGIGTAGVARLSFWRSCFCALCE